MNFPNEICELCLAHFIRASGKRKTVSTSYTVWFMSYLCYAVLYKIFVCESVSFFVRNCELLLQLWVTCLFMVSLKNTIVLKNHTSIVEYHTIHSRNLFLCREDYWFFFFRLLVLRLSRSWTISSSFRVPK